jgi:hypothetical protein
LAPTCKYCDSELNEFTISAKKNSCRACHSAYQRQYHTDKPHYLNARNVAWSLFNRGVIIKENCKLCDSPDSEMHHPDYAKPKDVVWLCKKCHHEFHILERRIKKGFAPIFYPHSIHECHNKS